MGLDYVLEDENRMPIREIGDPTGLLSGLLDRAYDEQLPLLSGVDRYGDTVFNRQQMPRVLEEWRHLFQWSTSSEQRTLISAVVELRQECESRVHTYVRIVGD